MAYQIRVNLRYQANRNRQDNTSGYETDEAKLVPGGDISSFNSLFFDSGI